VANAEEELARLQRTEDASVFLCTALPAGEVGSEVFLQPVWSAPSGDGLVALLPL
jgi:hypothetical protein